MVLQAIYSSPTTPGGAGWSEDVAGDIRLGSIDGVSCEAELGATGEGSNVIDDPDGTAGHNSDGIVGLKQWKLNETACPVGNQRLWTGYTADRGYERGKTEPSGTQSSLITEEARKIDISLVDLNWFLSFRVFAPLADDPTSYFKGLAETDLERVQRMLSTVDFLTTTLYDIGYIPSTGGVAMDATDAEYYVGKRPIDVLNDCAQVSGRNFFVTYDEASGHYVLWYDVWDTDGSATLAFDATIQLSNVLAEVDNTTIFAATAKGKLDPSRVVSAIRGTGTGVTGYRTRPTTAYTYAWRDGDPLTPAVKTQAKLNALLDRYLLDNSTEDNRISATVKLPAAKATALRAGQRIRCHFTHVPGVQTAFTWCRILQTTLRQDQETDAFYWYDLEMSPIKPPPIVQYYTLTADLGCFASSWPAPPGEGNRLVSLIDFRAGPTIPDASNVPIGNTGASGSACDSRLDIAGTDWSFIASSGFNVSSGDLYFAGYPVGAATRVGAVSEPQTTRWKASGRSRVHYFEIDITAYSGTPTLLGSSYNIAGSAVITSPTLTIPGAGLVVWLCSYPCPGPDDGASPFFTMNARAPAVGLTGGYAPNYFGPNSAAGYLIATGAGSATITLDRTAAPRDNGVYGWLCIFIPA